MLKLSTKHSVRVSLIIAVLFLAALVGSCFFASYVADIILSLPEGIVAEPAVTENTPLFLTGVIYAIIATAAVATVCMICLLLRIHRGLVFTAPSIALLRAVSWCCMLGCIFFALIGIYAQLALPVAFVALFVGLCLRVVKNVVQEAAEIKSENDLTV